MSIVHYLVCPCHRALIGSVLAWASRRNAQVCAEGIESEAQLDRLGQLGVHLGQGFRIGRPEHASNTPVTGRPNPVRPQRTPEQRAGSEVEPV